MQDQLTGNSSNLQQQQGNLQQNTPNLQQSGTPTSTADTSSVLSEAPPSGQLQVTTATSTNSTIQPDPTLQHGGSHSWLLVLLVAAVALAMYVGYIFWTRAAATIEELQTAEEPIEIQPASTPAPKKTKAKKKSKNRKKSGRR